MAIIWSNLVTRHPDTGAYRILTPDLLAEVHLAPINPQLDWETALSHPNAPWSASFSAAPRPVRQAVERAFRDLVSATPDGQIDRIDETALPDGRARRHLKGLLALGRNLGALPEDLAVVRHVLGGAASLEPLPMCPPPETGFDSVLEEALHAQLCAVHGVAPARQGLPSSAGMEGTALRHVQDALTDTLAERVAPDDSLRFFGVRDMGEEAELAAGIARKLINTGCAPHEIAVMLPDATYGADLFLSGFEAAGIPLSGVPETAERDTAGEILWLLLRALRQHPPVMVLASLCLLPDMPWPEEQGRKMARSLMDYGKRDVLPDWLTDALRQEPRSYKALMGRLWELARHLPTLKDRVGRVAVLAPSDESASPDWEILLEATRPETSLPQAGERFVEAASLWLGDAEPWRAARHLIVAGFAGNSFPRGAGVGPVFLDSELQQLQDLCGLRLPPRALLMRRNLSLFSRQIGAVSGSISFISPSRDLAGKKLGPTTALSLIARALESGDEDAGALVSNLRTLPVSDWPCAAVSVAQTLDVTPVFPATGNLAIRRDVLRIRQDEGGVMKPQSPSRLETMLVSPLVWVMTEAGARQVEWRPETMDILVQGSLYHAVLENLFPEGEPTPDEARLRANFDAAFDKAVRKKARFLQDDLWSVEHANHRAEAMKIAMVWRSRLEEVGAKVIATEQPLAGDALGLRLNGFADTVLELPDGQKLVVDFKTSKSNTRRQRMEAGWDIQVALYQHMISRPGNKETAAIKAGGCTPAIAYHLLRDGVTLGNGLNHDGVGIESISSDISGEAMQRLTRTIAELGGGTIRLNRTRDVSFFEKEAGIAPYALKDNPLGAVFIMAEDEA
ncbi:PD-(D/E)XK nuclease family protein [Candidatus Halocynthiibacter alkanivorans]|uniref:PD-(D/E)XK nuclease family protein n=1 Tax=Candidatus Halocynthiibacter alkanivorans TaxID=2267619 RepID=UPI000DF16265|nr:PD-(D/E)XK nuclease family protein [Candidatus Halocynthiibacter alkanivorans]